ncbi:Lysine methyltransferase [Komagataella phaffii CBS 7435]|uniref:Protein-lysine N-methyltransferase EFM4 n=2 Tax=Komagataella phaffii TaxID=460519 RepID=C4R8F0_KOMPG|nr:Putative S-adenosylmethionine-dependent methyltransferase of the seven beta-strand family [Komagataella phaffii GS115]AOA65319.1 GQ67_04989T0 [Komagataella phaffii]CAH2450724.1 Lysine methyltransferase [Komagataella phaffii CBS 7435]AOA69490.1 GQ68_04970T0 [Komagataella phaffii GS115]CAY71875.1 Putative S-adenosylmethionine-dependent methyltransferase of the seven beta-strand family [Komagataella phaffii GS115]CCA40524.1 Lysine methyltransferase [Komagataella phaffii CBS 7435]
MVEDTSKLNPSKLGTKEYWDDFYQLETANFKEDSENVGECWFDDSDAENKIIEFLFDRIEDGSSEFFHSNSRVCDLGTGNGHLLFELRKEGFRGDLVGLDYSEVSVEFARQIAQKHAVKGITFQQCDILDEKSSVLNDENDKFDILLDKGTFDAIALSSSTYNGGKTGIEIYPSTVKKLLKKGGILLVTSCNFTESELIKHITKNDEFAEEKHIEYPKFEFGGIQGQTICSICFIKN